MTQSHKWVPDTSRHVLYLHFPSTLLSNSRRQLLHTSSSLFKHHLSPWPYLIFSWEIRSNLNGVPLTFCLPTFFCTYSFYLPSWHYLVVSILLKKKKKPTCSTGISWSTSSHYLAVLPSLSCLIHFFHSSASVSSDLVYLVLKITLPWPKVPSNFHHISFFLYTAKTSKE